MDEFLSLPKQVFNVPKVFSGSTIKTFGALVTKGSEPAGRTLGLDKARSDARMQTVHQSSALGHGSAKALVVVSALTVH